MSKTKKIKASVILGKSSKEVMDKIKLIDNPPSLKEIQELLDKRAIELAEMKAKGEKPLEFVDYLNICSPSGITDTSINRSYVRLRNFVENNPIHIKKLK